MCVYGVCVCVYMTMTILKLRNTRCSQGLVYFIIILAIIRLDERSPSGHIPELAGQLRPGTSPPP